MTRLCFLLLLMTGICTGNAQDGHHMVKRLKITILSTMLAQQSGLGEWGFSALVEADSVRILFDAGAREYTVINNCQELKVDLTGVRDLVLSHNHDDHTTGWLPLRQALSTSQHAALSVTHVGQGLFYPRITGDGKEYRDRLDDSLRYVRTGGNIITYADFREISPGVYLTGPVPRKYAEKNYGLGGKIGSVRLASGQVAEDIVIEDMSMVIRTEKGLVLLSGCGHSGIINTVAYAREKLPGQPLLAAIGGFHLLQNTDEQLRWTAGQLKDAGIRYFMGAHCTGIEPVYQIRDWAGLKRGECLVGSVGSIFDLEKGIVAGPLTR